MTHVEASKLLAVLRAAYPAYYRDPRPEEIKTAVNLWQNIFAAEPYELVSASVAAFISNDTKGFPPVPGQLKERIYDLLNPDEPTEQEAWQIVNRAICKASIYATKAFDDLPPELQKLVGSNRQLIDWGRMDETQVDTVVASNFMRSYKEIRRRKKERAALPSGVMQTLTQSEQSLLGGRTK